MSVHYLAGYVVETGSVGEWFLVLGLDGSDTRITIAAGGNHGTIKDEAQGNRADEMRWD